MPRLRLLLLGLVLVVVAVHTGAASDDTRAQGTGPHRAGVVVQFGNGEAFASCVSFSEPSISGYDLLRRSGLTVVAEPRGGLGAAVCKINDARRQNGCDFPADDCFCQCTNPAGNCQYWAYYHQQNGAWVYSDVGGGGWQVSGGMVDGWAWGEGEINQSGAVPPLLGFDHICVPAQASPTPTPTTQPTFTPTPTFIPTSTPTFTPTPTLTPTPTGTVFTATPTPTGLFTATPLPATSTPQPASTAVLAVGVEFTAQPEIIGVGSCTTLRWNVQSADAAFLKVGEDPEQSVALSSALNVCPTQNTVYTVRGMRGSVQQGRSLVVQVIAAGTPVPTPAATVTFPPTLAPATSFVAVPEIPLPTPTPSPVPTVAAVVMPAGTPPPGSGVVARPVPIFTPAATPSLSTGSASVFLGIGGFALLLAVVAGAGLWALSRQTSTRRPPPPPPPPPAPTAAP